MEAHSSGVAMVSSGTPVCFITLAFLVDAILRRECKPRPDRVAVAVADLFLDPDAVSLREIYLRMRTLTLTLTLTLCGVIT